VLVIDGDLAGVPGQADLNRRPLPGLAFGCMAETMALALERRFEDDTVGNDSEIERAGETEHFAGRHGFGLAGLRSFGRSVTRGQIRTVRRKAAQTTGPDPDQFRRSCDE
jgi:fatty aldehyde-generating acyl-ACP reductase